jgi:hypothetical protein
MIWLMRTLGVLVLSFGIALLVAPFPRVMTANSESTMIRLDMGETPLNMEEALSLYGRPITELTADNLETMPILREEMVRLWHDGGGTCIPEKEWKSFGNVLGGDPNVGVLFVFRDSLQRIDGISARADDGDFCFTTERLATFDNPDFDPAVRLDVETLAAYPEVFAAVKGRTRDGLDAGPSGPAVSEVEWRRFYRKELQTERPGTQFVVDGALFWGVEQERHEARTRSTPWLRPATAASGVVLVLLGGFLMLRMYRLRSARPGIATQTLGVAVFGDIVALVAGSYLFLNCIDALWSVALEQPGLAPLLTGATPGRLSGISFMSIPGVLFGLPIFTLAVSLITEQRVIVDEAGILSIGVAGKAFVPWNELEAVRLTGKGKNQLVELLSINRMINIAMASERCRDQVKTALRQLAPADKQHLFRELEAKW